MPQPQRQPQVSLSDALRNFSEAAQQLAQSWEHEYGQGAPNPFSAIPVPSLPNQHAAPVEPPAKVEGTAESRSTPTPEVQDMDSILQRECAVSSDMESGDEGRAQTQQDQKVCLRCFRSWKHNIQAGEDVRPCVFSQGRSGRAFKCQYCSTGRLECIAIPASITRPVMQQKAAFEGAARGADESRSHERFLEAYSNAWAAIRRTPSLQRSGRWSSRGKEGTR
ncbi:uncharacterized protein N7506_007484 [Penicillium brevicompactum]|uniref:uncharacterized protein n=1 Tax=Penicillium brevicompactum TaxID=5074 RepID=UPI0025407526|nr:uncharacterized protein N7506_007484 [Penicillium brevicompactum]KAJ5333701.1 hypothetical protein N7506_007484 [Penicillium brevicompactum]